MVLLQMTVRHGPHGPAPGAQGQGRVAYEEMAALEGGAFFSLGLLSTDKSTRIIKRLKAGDRPVD